MSSSDMSSIQRIVPRGRGWDLDNVVNLERGTQLVYEGEAELSAGGCGVIFPCKLKFYTPSGYRLIDAVVKCEYKKSNDKDGYEIHKVRKIPHHGNLVKFYDGKVLGPDESSFFGALMVFERMDCNLEQLVFDDPNFAETRTYGDLVNILKQIIQGLMHLNENGYIHLDLKPQNVLVAKSLEGRILVKIGDFGESKQVNDKGQSVTATRRGTQLYMAPEVRCAPPISDKTRRITELVDVYSFGMLMYVLLNKRNLSFTSRQQYPVGREILVGDVKPYKIFCGAPLELCDLIEQCLQFKFSKISDSREHGRPSLGEALKALRNMKECQWMTQSLETKEQQGDHHSCTPTKDSTDEVPGDIPLSKQDGGGLFQTLWMDILNMEKIIFYSKENVSTQLKNLSRALMKAANDENIRGAINILNRGADLNWRDKYGWSALHRACGNGHAEVAKMLLESGADVNPVDMDGYSALYRACENGHPEVAKLLLNSGADVNLVDRYGRSALYRACEYGHAEVANLLLDSGAGVN